jgi:hypothetical protein
MISPFRLKANRRNALRSTGPKTAEGKQRSRANALRHGLTAETIVPSLEDAEDYKAFEAVIISDYCAETAVARELVLRLASLLWRIRRATAIETQLLEMQAEASRRSLAKPATEDQGIREIPFRSPDSGKSLQSCGNTTKIFSFCRTENSAAAHQREPNDVSAGDCVDAARQLADCFLRLTNNLHLPTFERLSRYEAALWRQAVQIIWVLDPIRPR